MSPIATEPHFNKQLYRFGVSFFRINSDEVFWFFFFFNNLDTNLHPTTNLLLGSQAFPEY